MMDSANSCCQGKSVCVGVCGVSSLILVEHTMSSRPSHKGISNRLYREKALQRGDHPPSHAIVNDSPSIRWPLVQKGQSLGNPADLDGAKSVPHIDWTVERTIHHFLQFLIAWLLQAKRPAAEKIRQRVLSFKDVRPLNGPRPNGGGLWLVHLRRRAILAAHPLEKVRSDVDLVTAAGIVFVGHWAKITAFVDDLAYLSANP